MRKRTILASLAVFLGGIALCLAADSPQMGTWKLNESKSKFSPDSGKNHTVVYAASGDMVKVTVDGNDKDGKPTHNEWTGKFDGKDYPVTGDPTSDTRAYKMVDAHKLDMTIKKGGKVTMTGTIEVAHDGKTRTVHTKGTDASGKKVENKAVYDRQ
jgi:hypothetical protein